MNEKTHVKLCEQDIGDLHAILSTSPRPFYVGTKLGAVDLFIVRWDIWWVENEEVDVMV